ncbi:MAG: hypothetical protein H6502_05060 [Candidatus Woesearchaeota archaeon]|nr:MAG: hypothetical protein H6502_05060 [Candidatus Woesearchaeota archaeon]
MNQKITGGIVLLIGLLLIGGAFVERGQENEMISLYMQETGSCYLENGTCLHDEQATWWFVTSLTSGIIISILGTYLLFFDHLVQAMLSKRQELDATLKEVHEKGEAKSFESFLQGFSKDEQLILRAIKAQEGIKQATLRYKTGLSKTSLSLLLKSLEERDIVAKKPSGKSYELYLKKGF